MRATMTLLLALLSNVEAVSLRPSPGGLGLRLMDGQKTVWTYAPRGREVSGYLDGQRVVLAVNQVQVLSPGKWVDPQRGHVLVLNARTGRPLWRGPEEDGRIGFEPGSEGQRLVVSTWNSSGAAMSAATVIYRLSDGKRAGVFDRSVLAVQSGRVLLMARPSTGQSWDGPLDLDPLILPLLAVDANPLQPRILFRSLSVPQRPNCGEVRTVEGNRADVSVRGKLVQLRRQDRCGRFSVTWSWWDAAPRPQIQSLR